MGEVRGERASSNHFEAYTKFTTILFQSPMILTRFCRSYTGMIWEKAMSDKLNDLGTLFITKNECLYHRVRVERPDNHSVLIADVLHCLVHITYYFKLYLLSRTDTCQAVNCLPWLVTNPSSFNRLAISLRLRS